MKHLLLTAILLSMLTVIACGRAALPAASIPQKNAGLIIWAHSDIQPNTPEEMNQYETAFTDMKTLPFTPDMSIVAGDLVHRLHSQYYWNWMLGLRRQIDIPLWYEIAGNHDLNDFPSYLKNSGKPRHYAVICGNILFIFLSDEIRSAPTDISDRAFEWWKDLVITHQNYIIVTVTHAELEQSSMIATINKTMCIKGSDRFWNVIRQYKVDLWLSAHTHLPNRFDIKSSTPKGCSTLFLDISGIHRSFGKPVESWILIFRNGSPSLLCAPRNHETGEFYSQRIFTLQLSRPFIPSGRAPEMLPFKE